MVFKSFYRVEHTTISPYLLGLQDEYPDIDYRDCFVILNWLTLYEVYPMKFTQFSWLDGSEAKNTLGPK